MKLSSTVVKSVKSVEYPCGPLWGVVLGMMVILSRGCVRVALCEQRMNSCIFVSANRLFLQRMRACVPPKQREAPNLTTSNQYVRKRCGGYRASACTPCGIASQQRPRQPNLPALCLGTPSLLGARTLLGAPGRTTRSKDATRSKGHRY